MSSRIIPLVSVLLLYAVVASSISLAGFTNTHGGYVPNQSVDTNSTPTFVGLTLNDSLTTTNVFTNTLVATSTNFNGINFAPTNGLGLAGDFLTTDGTGNVSWIPTPFNGTVLDSQFKIVDNVDQTRQVQFDVQGNTSTITTIQTDPTVSRTLITPDIDGTLLVSQTGTGEVFIGSTGPLHGSNSGIQYSSTFPSRAQIRENQYGNNTGVPGISTFKSRGTTIGSLAPVVPGDVIYRATAVGVTDNLSIPLSGLISILVPPNGVPTGQGWIATDYEIQLVPLAGPANGRRQIFRITSEGIFHVCERSNSMAGIATTIAGGSVTVLNTQITSTSRITLTIQSGGAVPTGFVYVSNTVVGTSFTITSSTADVGVIVYYQIWEPTV